MTTSSRSTSPHRLRMNRYGAMAWEQWERHRPAELAKMTDPVTEFTNLGNLIASEIDSRDHDPADRGSDPGTRPRADRGDRDRPARDDLVTDRTGQLGLDFERGARRDAHRGDPDRVRRHHEPGPLGTITADTTTADTVAADEPDQTEPARRVATRWRPASSDVALPGQATKARDNLTALRTLRRLQAEQRAATVDEQAVLGRWASWGAIPNVFADDPGDWAATASQLRGLVSETEWAAARRTTINAHYTGAALVAPVWRFLTRVGLTGGTVLEPGCGSGNFIGFAPAELDEALSWIGIELDPITAQIAQHLYPDADIRNEGFETTAMPDASVDLVVGNVPFGQVALNDPIHNPTRESIHNHFIVKGLRLLRPGGYLAVITSRYTLDARNPTARLAMADLADLEFAARFPSSAHHEVAGTSAVTDLLILRRRPEGAPVEHVGEWADTATIDTVDGPVVVNEYLANRPHLILGTPRLGGAYGRDMLRVEGRLDELALDRLISAAADVAVERGHRQQPIAPAPTIDRAAAVVVVDQHVDTARLKPGSIVALANGFGRYLDRSVIEYDAPGLGTPRAARLVPAP